MSEALRIVIVGGVAGGMSAATRARRVNENAQITVIEKSGHISFANCGLPYYLDGRIPSQEKLLLTTPQQVAERFRIDARVNQEVIAIDRARKVVRVRELANGREYELAYDKLILAPGASPIVPPIANVSAKNVFVVRNVEDIVRARGFLKSHEPRRAVIVGGGYIGLEMADVLRHAGLEVTMVEKSPRPMALLDEEMAGPIIEELQSNGVELVLGDGLAELQASDDQQVRQVVTESGKKLSADMVVLAIGVRPNVELARAAGLEIGAAGAIRVDEYQRTSDRDIYAVGDAAEVIHGVTGKTARIPLAGGANRGGRIAGEHAAKGRSESAGRVLGTSIVQIFGIAAGLTGLSESAARSAGFDAHSSIVLPSHHAGYYPGSCQLSLKLLVDPETDEILGVHIVGPMASELIAEACVAMAFRASSEDIARICHAHPSLSESTKEAALAVDKRTLNF